jgi:hypothetical protein
MVNQNLKAVPVLRIQDVYLRSRIRFFPSRIRIRNTEMFHSKLILCFVSSNAVLQIRMRDPVPFRSRDQEYVFSGSWISNPRSQTHVFESLVTIYRVKCSIILWKWAKFFSSTFQNKIVYNFVKFIATKQVCQLIFFTTLLNCCFWILDG